MANGGDTREELDRLEVQVDATRTDLAEVGAAVDGLRDLVTELVRRSSSEHQSEQWQARLGSLETRLEMMETAIRSEVERMRGAAGTVDALADDFRSTVGDTRSLVQLAGDIGEQLRGLQSLEGGVRGAAHDMTAALEQHLDRDARERESSQSDLVHRVAATVADSQGALAELAGRLDAITRATAELPAVEARLSAQLLDATAWGDAFDGLRDELGRVRSELGAATETTQRAQADALEQLSTEIRDVESRLADATAADARLTDMATTLAQVRAQQPQLAARLDQLSGELSEIHEGFAQPLASVADIGDRVDALASAMRNVVASQPDPRPHLEQLSAAVDSLRDAQLQTGDLASRLDALVAEVRATPPEQRDALERITVELSTIRSSIVDPSDNLARLAADITELRATLAALRAEQPDIGGVVERLQGDLAVIRATLPSVDDLRADIASVRAAIPDTSASGERIAYLLDQQSAALVELQAAPPLLGDRLDRLTAELAELRAREPAPAVDLGPVSDRVDGLRAELREQLDHVQTTQREAAVDLAPISERLDAMTTSLTAEVAELRAVPTPEIDLQPLVERLDAAADQLSQLRSTQPVTEAIVSRMASVLSDHSGALAQLQSGHPQVVVRLDQLAADLADLSTQVAQPSTEGEQLDRIAAELAALRTADWISPALSPLSERVDAQAAQVQSALAALPDLRPELQGLTDALAEVRTAVQATGDHNWQAAHDARLVDITDRVQSLLTAQPDLGDRLAQVQAELADIRSRTPDPAAAIAPVAERITELAGEVGRLHDGQAALHELGPRIDALHAAQLDPTALQDFFASRVDRVAAEIAELRAIQPEPGAAATAIAPVADAVERLQAEISIVREQQPATGALADALHGRLDELNGGLDSLRAQLRDMPAPSIDVSDAFAPVHDRLSILDERSGATAAAVSQLEGLLNRTSNQIGEITTAIGALGRESDDASVLAPVVDRLATVADTVSSMHGDVAGIADVLATVRGDRAALAQQATQTTERLDLLAATVADLHVNRPDFSSSFSAMTTLIDSLQSGITDTRTRIDDLREELRAADSHEAVASELAPVHERLDALATRASETEGQVGAVLAAIVELAGRDDAERITALDAHLEEVRRTIDGLGDRHASALTEVAQRFEQLSANTAATQETVRALDAVLSAPRDNGTDERLADIGQQVVGLAADVRSTVRSIVGLGADVTGLRAQLETLVAALPDLAGADAEARDALARLDAAAAQRESHLRATVEHLDAAAGARDAELRDAIDRVAAALTGRDADVAGSVARLDDAMAARDAAARDVLGRLDAAMSQVGSGADSDRIAGQIDAGLADLRRELQEVARVAANTDVLDLVRTFTARDPEEAVAGISNGLRDVRADVQSTRTELQALGQTLGELRAEVRRSSEEVVGGAGAALVASAAAAMARLEGRMDGEFDNVGRQMEALGTLLGQVIDSVQRVEAEVVGIHPVTEKTRSAAATVLDSLRTSVRQRSARRPPPPELGSGL